MSDLLALVDLLKFHAEAMPPRKRREFTSYLNGLEKPQQMRLPLVRDVGHV